MSYSEKSLEEIITTLCEKIVANVNPLRIVLFGQAVTLSSESVETLNLLLIMPNETHRRKTAQDLRKSLGFVGMPFDIIVATTEDIEKYGEEPAMIYSSILKEGREIYNNSK